MKYSPIYLIISGLVIGPGLVSLVIFGLKPGLDFTGGSRLELDLAATGSAQVVEKATAIREYLIENRVDFNEVRPTPVGAVLKTKEINEERKNAIISDLRAKVGPVSERSFETLGPVLGRELLFKTALGVILATVLIALYIVYQFKSLVFGLCASLATLHDSLVILGIFSLLGKFFGVEVDTLFVTAVLTVLSFSVHDTIVVYDRIREKMTRFKVDFSGVSPGELSSLIDSAVGETLVRSLNNSLTVIFMLTALVVLGGESTRFFALALLIGTISGTYSSPFVAGPLLVLLKKIQTRRARFRLISK